MTDQEKNKILLAWARWIPCNYVDEASRTYYEENLPDYLNTNASFGLLDVLVERGYAFRLWKQPSTGWDLTIFTTNAKADSIFVEDESTKHRAIVEAILALIEKEKTDAN